MNNDIVNTSRLRDESQLSSRKVKNALAIEGHIDRAFRAILLGNEPDAIHAEIVGLVHMAVDTAFAVVEAEVRSLRSQGEPVAHAVSKHGSGYTIVMYQTDYFKREEAEFGLVRLYAPPSQPIASDVVAAPHSDTAGELK